MGHVELISNTINILLEGASAHAEPEELPLSVALESPNIHHFLVAGQSSRPTDAAGNPWSATYIYDSGNLVLNMLYNLILEATGRLQKCRLYEMSNNKAYRATVSYLIVRDLAHEKVFAKALETLGVNWNKILPIPKVDTSKMPEVKELEDRNLHNQQWTFTNEDSELSKIFSGCSPFGDGEIETLDGLPEGVKIPDLSDAEQKFSSGLHEELKKLVKNIQTVGKTSTKTKTRS